MLSQKQQRGPNGQNSHNAAELSRYASSGSTFSQESDISIAQTQSWVEHTSDGAAQMPDLDAQMRSLQLEDDTGLPDVQDERDAASVRSDQSYMSSSSQRSSKFKESMGNFKTWAGGIISHPHQSTKHYSVLRHSPAIVYYRGPSTSVSITIFSDRPLPDNREMWMQKRGFSGNKGMAIRTLGSRSAWINVTPASSAGADLLPGGDERAFQRDMRKFAKKTARAKHASRHIPRETAVVRIPYMAEDGYFRIVLCAGRKVLCPSPVFRLASSSTDPSIVRGASLSSMPLELAIMASSVFAKQTATAASQGALTPIIASCQAAASPYMPSQSTQQMLGAAYSAASAASTAGGVIGSAGGDDDDDEAQASSPNGQQSSRVLPISATEDQYTSGPGGAFPVTVVCKLAERQDYNGIPIGILEIILTDVPRDTLLLPSGSYIGWASLQRSKKSKAQDVGEELYDTWLETLIIIRSAPNQRAQVVERKALSIYILADLEDQDRDAFTKIEVRIKVLILGFLRPEYAGTDMDLESQQLRLVTDVSAVQGILEDPAWSAEVVLQRAKDDASSRSLSRRMTDAKSSGKKQFGKTPMHWVGVRSGGIAEKDEKIGKGGFYVRR